VRLFVASIPYEIDDSGLFALFADAGFTVAMAKLVRHNDGRSKGFAFVDIVDQEEAAAAIRQMNGYSVHNRSLVVEPAKPARGD
jgi:RNA recognition motif-containing protein